MLMLAAVFAQFSRSCPDCDRDDDDDDEVKILFFPHRENVVDVYLHFLTSEACYADHEGRHSSTDWKKKTKQNNIC